MGIRTDAYLFQGMISLLRVHWQQAESQSISLSRRILLNNNLLWKKLYTYISCMKLMCTILYP